MKMRVTVGGDAPLIARDGTVIGQLEGVTITLDLAALARTGDGAGAARTPAGSDVDVEVQSLERAVNTPLPQASMLPDPVDETWAVYVEALDRPRAVLTPKVRKWITDAHKAVGVDMTRDAIRGLAASDYHRTNGYVGIEYALVPKRGETIEGRMEKMIANTPRPASVTAIGPMTVEQFVRGFAHPEAQRRAQGAIEAIEQELRYPDDEEVAVRAKIAKQRLEENGFRATVDRTQVVAIERA